MVDSWLGGLTPFLGNTATEIKRSGPESVECRANHPFCFHQLRTAVALALADRDAGRTGQYQSPPDGQNDRAGPPLALNTAMLKLGVNIDHVATVREARYRGWERGEPDPIEAALLCESAGAHGITAHLREDRRHIQDRDLRRLREGVETRLNLEMADSRKSSLLPSSSSLTLFASCRSAARK